MRSQQAAIRLAPNSAPKDTRPTKEAEAIVLWLHDMVPQKGPTGRDSNLT